MGVTRRWFVSGVVLASGVGAAFGLAGCGKKSAAASVSAASVVINVGAKASDASPLAGEGIAPKTAPGDHFSDQFLDLLRVGKLDRLADNFFTIDEVPADLSEKYSHSTDPVIRQMVALEVRLRDDQQKWVAADKVQADLARQIEAEASNLANVRSTTERQSVFIPSPSGPYGNGGHVEQQDVERFHIDMTRIKPLQNQQAAQETVKDTAYADIEHTMDQLATLCHDVGIHAAPTKINADAVAVTYDIEWNGIAVVHIRNNTGKPLHHCLVLARGESNPSNKVDVQDALNAILAPVNPVAAGKAALPRPDQLASIDIRYTEEVTPDFVIPLYSCMTCDPDAVKSTTVSIWSDEVVAPDIQVTGLAEAIARTRGR